METSIEENVGVEDIERIAAALPGDISIYEVVGGQLKPLYHSDSIPGFSGMAAQEYDDLIAEDAAASSSTPIGTSCPDRSPNSG